MRVYEFSKQLGIDNKEIVKLLRKEGFDVASHMSVLPQSAIDFLQNKYSKKIAQTSTADTSDVALSVSESSKQSKETAPQSVVENKQDETLNIIEDQQNSIESSALTDTSSPTIIGEPMVVADFAAKIKKPVTDVIITLLKRGTALAKNQVMPASLVQQVAQSYGFTVLDPQKNVTRHKKVALEGGGHGEDRPPVVVVIGHVDHGKTTLLDYIRKTRVAAKEKGGITQHLGAYEVKTVHGNIVFLDTPGHEAFIKMRMRGVRVADIAILVVAADDGVKPQTIEAIKHALSTNVPIVVALNKIDKATQAQVDATKRGLSQQGLVAEEWGGQTIMVPISAKNGTGIDQLLEMIALQAQLMELRADRSGTAQGFVLEAKIEKGLGPVATIICQEGTLKVGDYFIANSITGKVSLIINSSGERLKEVGPSIPVKISGFDQLPEAGDFFNVIDQATYKKSRHKDKAKTFVGEQKSADDKKMIRLIIKADNNSSKEALIGAIEKLRESEKTHPISLIHVAVGDVSESDVILALNTGATIYGFHVKADPKAMAYAQRSGVQINFYQIIYQLLDNLALVAKKDAVISYTKTKVGEATVLCTFKVKTMGIIAGAKVIEGRIVKDGTVIVKRGRYKVGEGSIKSLQREKRVVKEVHAGYECAFLIDGFQDWQVDDRVECFLEVPTADSAKQ